MNNLDEKIEFTVETSNEHLPFLDVLVVKGKERIITDIYHKATDTFNYMPFSSNHPRSTKINIPYNLALRIQMLVFNTTTKEERFKELRQILKTKEYPDNIIDNGINNARKIDRTTLLQEKGNDDMEENIAFITTHNPNNPQVTGLIKQTFNNIKKSNKLRRIFNNKKLVIAKRKTPNIKQMISRAAFTLNSTTNGIKKCKRPKCVTCSHFEEVSEIIFKNSDQTFKMKREFTCSSKNVIYLLKCVCGAEYIGETNDIKKRTTLHRSNGKHDKYAILKVSKHLLSCSQGKFHMYPFYKMTTENIDQRKTKESYFIKKYKPELNSEK